jgi:hypothetical protein
MQNRLFFPQDALDQWIVDEAVELSANELTLLADARRYRIAEAVHVKREVTGAPDPHELVGKVKSRAFLLELGAEIVEGSMLVGDNAYDVVTGWMGSPVGTLEEHLGSAARKKAREARGASKADPATEEELLTRFLAKTL